MEQISDFKILFVDDNEDFCKLAGDLIFQHTGIKPLIAKDGAEAQQMTQKYGPDVIITDTNMPVKNGIELIKFVRLIYPEIIIFSLFSGLSGSYITADEVRDMGVTMVLEKTEFESKLLPALKKLVMDAY